MKTCLLLAALLSLAACSSNSPQTKEIKEEPLRRYELKGEIVSLDAKDRIAKIKHEQIGDWMGPMTMDFPVKEESEFAKLKEGQQVQGTVFVQGFGYWVGEFRRLRRLRTQRKLPLPNNNRFACKRGAGTRVLR
jgi:Cu/Ag efflux protein CusF